MLDGFADLFNFSKEYTYLKDKTAATLNKYYESRNHVKKQLQAGGFSDMIRGIQAKTHINIGPDLEGYKGEVSFLNVFLGILFIINDNNFMNLSLLM